jgi:subtilisin family serine protease
MPCYPFAKSQTRIRLALTFSFLLGLILLAAVRLPPSSRATLKVTSTPNAKVKRTRPEFVPGEVLVRYQSESVAKLQPRTKTLQSSEGQSIVMQVERFEGSDIVAGLRIARVAPEDTLKAIEALRQQPDVLYAEPNYLLYPNTTTPNDPSFGQLYGLVKIGAPQAWDIQKGSTSVVVGVIDEGIDISHPDLQANIWTNPAPGSIPGFTGDAHGYDFINNTGTFPGEDHATHVAGTIGAVGNNGQGVVGVNWNVSLMSLRFLSASSGTGGSDSDVIRACSYAKQMRDLWISSGGTKGANIRVLNNSYGGGDFTQSLLDGINALNQSGILFVAAAGNITSFTPEPNNDLLAHYPSSYNAPNVLAVSATDQNDNLASFSHYGLASVQMGAPGVGILSTTPNNTYSFFSGTSMASPHVAGAAALLLAQNPNLTAQQLKNLLLFNGDVVAALLDRTRTGRRLNVFSSLQALAENDVTPPGTVTNFHINTQIGRALNLGWIASGDDAASGQASLYQMTFNDSATGVVIPLKNVIPTSSGSVQTVDIKIPYRHHVGTINLREFDNLGNEGTPVSVPVTVSFAEGDPYAPTLGVPATLSTGGTLIPELTFDDRYKEDQALPFSFPFFGQSYNSVTISTNGNLYFSPPPKRTNGDADDVPGSSVDLAKFKMIAGLWDDLYLGTDQRSDAGVYVVQPDSSRIIFRWQGVPCNAGPPNGDCTFGGAPVNFEIELRNDGTVQVRYGSGNTNLFPVVGISGGEPDAYVITSHTSEINPTSLTNAEKVTFLPRAVMNPLDNADFFVSQLYRDFLSRESDPGGLLHWTGEITSCPAGDQVCIHDRRIAVADSFFFSDEFQQTGSYVFRVYRLAFGDNQPDPNPDPGDPGGAFYPGPDFHKKMPSYAAFNPDRLQVVGGSNLPQSQLDFANAFVQRQKFIDKYSLSLSSTDFINALLATIHSADPSVDLSSQFSALMNLYNAGGRGAVVYRLADDNQANPINNRPFIDEEYNLTFVTTEYFGYLRRDGDANGMNFWLIQINSALLRNIDKQHAMVCSFINSTEYQLRFAEIITHNQQQECQ